MKKMVVLAAVAAIVAIIWAGQVSAFEWSSVEGTLNMQALREHGNEENTGGFSGLDTSALFKASGKHPSGKADSEGKLTGESQEDPTKAISKSQSQIETSVQAQGDKNVRIKLSGIASQGDWARLSNDQQDYADGVNFTWSEFIGSLCSTCGGNLSGDGKALADGKTIVELQTDADGKKAKATTIGKSLATLNLNRGGDPQAGGLGETQIGLSIEKPGISANIYNDASWEYKASGPRIAGGKGKADVEGEITNLPNGIRVKASAASKAQAGAH